MRACVKGVFGLLSRAMTLFSCAVPRDRRGSPWLSGYIYKGVKAGVAYPSAVSNLCIRQDIEDACRECKVYSACPHSPRRPQRTSTTLLPSRLVCLSALSTPECSAGGPDGARTVVTSAPKPGFFGTRSGWLGQHKRRMHAPGTWHFSVFCNGQVFNVRTGKKILR